MLYTCSSKALCLLEVLVHLDADHMPEDVVFVTIELPNTISKISLHSKKLNENWNKMPWSQETQKLGDEFMFNHNYMMLGVPSVIVPSDINYVLNPLHKDYFKIKIKSIELVQFDNRLLKIGKT